MTLEKFKYYLLKVILFCFVVGGIAAIINALSLYYLDSDIRVPIYMVCAVIIYPAVVVVLYGSILYVVLFLVSYYRKRKQTKLLKQTQQSDGLEYLSKCREYYMKGITPSNPDNYDTTEYKLLIEIGNKHIDESGVGKFAEYYQEAQYMVNLWTAHIILKSSSVTETQKERALEEIRRYANGALSVKIREEESEWLKVNGY